MSKSKKKHFPGHAALDFAMRVVRKLGADRVPLLSAGLSYSAALSMAPLVVVTLGLVGLVADRGQVQHYLVSQVQGLTGADAAGLVDELSSAQHSHGSGLLSTILGSIMLVVGASSVFVQLQNGLNVVWNVEPKPGRSLWTFLHQRLLSLAMIVSVGFLLLISLLANAVLSAALEALSGSEAAFGVVANTLIQVVLSGLLFAALFRFVPDARTGWRDVLLGGGVTAVLFKAGEWAIGQYLGRGTVGSPYGAAGSVIVMLVWVYYSAIIVFLGAEFTQQWAVRRGGGTVPEANARRGATLDPRRPRARAAS
ncbi:MAG TPA: YihY/virulence factor BrkB family protein [Planctomycetota bacterium]|nr:YihY/virulence factor BrkB family protein [Planctomycetota bacterium]